MRAIGYLRVSTADQADNGHGLDAQAAAITAEVERRGWDLLELVRENGSAARRRRRPEFERVLDRLGAGEADVLVSSRLDRVSRSVLDFHLLLERSRHEGWKLVVTSLGVEDLDSPEGKLFVSNLAAFAEFERDLIAQRTKDGLAAAKLKGKRVGRPRTLPQAAYDLADALRADNWSLRAIGEELEQQGFRPPRAERFSAEAVRAMLNRARDRDEVTS